MDPGAAHLIQMSINLSCISSSADSVATFEEKDLESYKKSSSIVHSPIDGLQQTGDAKISTCRQASVARTDNDHIVVAFFSSGDVRWEADSASAG